MVSIAHIVVTNVRNMFFAQMKLEKKRSSSMEKIMRKVKASEKKAEEMRKSVLDNRVVSNASSGGKSLCFRRSGKKKKIVSLSGCFTCHAYFSKKIR